MPFRDRLLASLREMQLVLDVPGVMVGGSQVPNLLEPGAASTLVVSQDVDLVVPVGRHSEVKRVLDREQKGAVVSNLTVLSLMKPIPEMPNPAAGREEVARLIKRLEAGA